MDLSTAVSLILLGLLAGGALGWYANAKNVLRKGRNAIANVIGTEDNPTNS